MFDLSEYRTKSKWLSDYLPWAALVAPGVVLQKGGVLQKTIAFRGPDLGSSSPAELQSNSARLNNVLKRLGSGWAYFSEAQRFKINEYVSSAWPNSASWIVDEERRGHYEEEGDHFESNYFLTFTWVMPSENVKKAEAIFIEDPNRDAQDHDYDNRRDLSYFIKTVKHIAGIMRDVFPEVVELNDDETLTYLHSTVSTRRHPVKAPDTPIYLDHILTDQRYEPGEIPVLGNHYIMTATINGFPSEAWPGILDSLNHLALEYRWSSRFICLDNQDAKVEIDKYRKNWFSKRKSLFTLVKEQASGTESRIVDTEAESNAVDAEAALEELANDVVAYGYYTSTITVWHTDLDICHQRLDTVMQVINSKGFTTRHETTNSFHALLSSLPGQVYANIRRPLINTLNVAHIFPLSAIWSGDRHDHHLAKETGTAAPLLVCNTTGNTPFRLSLSVGDVGHTFIAGPTGSGKSTLLSMLALQWLRYPNAQVIFFDKDRSVRAATMAVGGSIYEPGNEDRPVAFQPLVDIDTKAGLNWAEEWVETLLGLQNLTLTPKDKTELHNALHSLSTSPRKQRTIGGLQHLMQNQDVRDALNQYTLEGVYGQLFDSDHDTLQEDFWTMIEMGSLMDMGNNAIIPALGYLFYRIEQRFNGRPTLLVLDEAWLFMDHPFFAKRLRQWLKTLRKKNVYVVFATQEIEDAIKSPICSTLLSACMTKIYLPDNSATDPITFEAYAKLGLSETEIINLSKAVQKREYFYRSPKGKRMFDLELGDVALAFVGRSSASDQLFMDDLEKNHPPERWAELLLRQRNLTWAADMMAEPLSSLAS